MDENKRQHPRNLELVGTGMTTDPVAKALEPWIRVSTWHTNHPLDQARFHRALRSAFEVAGSSFDHERFIELVRDLLVQHQPGTSFEAHEDTIEEYARRVDVIAGYLYDSGYWSGIRSPT